MPQSNELLSLVKSLSPVEVLDYYDGPKFYSCRDVVGQLYLVYWIEESESETSWLYLKVSQDRYSALKRGDIFISEALSNPEDGLALVVVARSQDFFVEQITASEINPYWLPDSEDRLALEEASLPTKITSASNLAPRVHRQVLDIAFEKMTNTYEMAAGKLGRLLEAFQNTIYALSCDVRMDVRRVPEEIKQKSEMLVTGLFASSFGVRLQSKGTDLFSSDETARAIKTLTELIATLQVPESLPDELHRINILARSRFKHLLKVMIESQVSLKADWGTPTGQGLQAQASFSDIVLSLQSIEMADSATSRTVERKARLVGVDVQSDFFALALDDGDVIKGKLSKALTIRKFEIPSRITAKLEETSTVDPLTDREKWTYILLDVT